MMMIVVMVMVMVVVMMVVVVVVVMVMVMTILLLLLLMMMVMVVTVFMTMMVSMTHMNGDVVEVEDDVQPHQGVFHADVASPWTAHHYRHRLPEMDTRFSNDVIAHSFRLTVCVRNGSFRWAAPTEW